LQLQYHAAGLRFSAVVWCGVVWLVPTMHRP
jgi:hypothetical protein